VDGFGAKRSRAPTDIERRGAADFGSTPNMARADVAAVAASLFQRGLLQPPVPARKPVVPASPADNSCPRLGHLPVHQHLHRSDVPCSSLSAFGVSAAKNVRCGGV
jgi:hypothetical protein